jgi:hypothetical protein
MSSAAYDIGVLERKVSGRRVQMNVWLTRATGGSCACKAYWSVGGDCAQLLAASRERAVRQLKRWELRERMLAEPV